MPLIGVDFGTTNSLIVAYDKIKNKFLYFSFEESLYDSVPAPISSTVWYHDGGIKVGFIARSNINKYSGVYGHHFEKSIKLRLGKNQPLSIFKDKVEAYQVAAEILKYLKQHAIERWSPEDEGVNLNKAVFTVPIKFTGEQRIDLRKAANEAGIEVITFIHEPFAAVVGYYFSQSTATSTDAIVSEMRNLDGKHLLTFDWGGGTLDITVVKVDNGKMIELGTSELTGYAGDRFDEEIAYWGWNRFYNKFKGKYSEDYLERNRKDKWDRILNTAEQCKILLSKQESAHFIIESIIPGKNDEGIDEIITQDDFNLLLKDTLEKAMNRIDDALQNAGINEVSIANVILTGGSCYIPVVQDMMKKKFGHRVELVKNAELLIAQGAAVIAEMGWLPILTKDISIELCDNSLWPIYERNTPIAPLIDAVKKETFICVDQREKNAKVIICEGFDQVKHRNLAVLNVPILGDKRFNDDIVFEACLNRDIVLTVKAHSILVHGYNQKERTGIDEEYSIQKITHIYQMCFGLEFGDTLNG